MADENTNNKKKVEIARFRFGLKAFCDRWHSNGVQCETVSIPTTTDRASFRRKEGKLGITMERHPKFFAVYKFQCRDFKVILHLLGKSGTLGQRQEKISIDRISNSSVLLPIYLTHQYLEDYECLQQSETKTDVFRQNSA